jgi:DNA polymerase-1
MTETLWETESDFIRLMASIKQRGIKIDSAFSRKKAIEGTRILNQTRGELGWNPGSSDQIGKYLIDELGLPVLKRTPQGKPSFDKEAMEEYELHLEALGDTTAQKVLTYRGWQKTVSSNFQAYLDLMDENEILHPNYKVHGTRTCRLSCEKPNLQQIPRDSPKPWNGDVKKAFIPRSWDLYADPKVLGEYTKQWQPPSGELRLRTFDFKQVEFRLAAAYAKETELLEIFNSGSADIFTELSKILQRPRPQIKTFVYSTLYGAGRKKVALVLGMPQWESDEFYDEYHGRWPGFRRISEKASQLASNQGYIKYWTGRRRHLTKGESHKAFNAIIQGGAFEIIKRRMLALPTFEPIVLQVHDSITVEDDDNCDIDRIKKTLENVPESSQFGVKFEVDMVVEGAKLN